MHVDFFDLSNLNLLILNYITWQNLKCKIRKAVKF